MLPFPYFISKRENLGPGSVVFRIGDLNPAVGIVDSGPFKIPIDNSGNLQILEDAHGTYIDFPRAENKILHFLANGKFNIAECTIRIVCSSSVITGGNTSLNCLIDNSNSFRTAGPVSFGVVGSPAQVTLRDADAYKFKIPIDAAKQEILDITVVYKNPFTTGCYMDIVGYDRVSSPYVAKSNTNPIYIGGASGDIYSSPTYQIRGKLYLVEIRLPPAL